MFKKLRNIVMGLSLMSLLAVPAFATAPVSAQFGDDCSGIEECLSGGAKATDPDSEGDAEDKVNDIIAMVINIFSVIVGVIAVIMIIIGGLKYITSGGDSGNVTSAKNTILFAVVGLVVVALAQIIVRYVLEQVTN